jgi:hypothetical protein
MSLSRVQVSRNKEVAHANHTAIPGKYLVGIVASLIIFLAGGWLILGDFRK